MRFVVMKGTAGWGDRLQCALQVVKYARASGRVLVMDWRDAEWSHDGQLSFEQYFDLHGIPHFSVHAFLLWWERNRHTCSILPNVWRHHMTRTEFNDLLYKDLFRTPEHAKTFNRIADYEIDDFEEDVVVYAGTGFRAFAYSDFGAFQPNAWFTRDLQQYGKRMGLTRHAYDVVHLRAGSKSWAGGHVALKDLKQKIDAKFPTVESYFDFLRTALKAAQIETGDRIPVYVLSDSATLAQAWIAAVGGGTFLNHSADAAFSASGVHQLTAKELAGTSITKMQINLDTLRDFAIMMNARHVIWDGMSLFSKMAVACRTSAHPNWYFEGPVERKD